MKIRLSISREYDTEESEHAHLFENNSNPEELALRYFAEDLDLMSHADFIRQVKVETLKS